MVINTNVSAVNANRTLTLRSQELQSVSEKIASGKKINTASDNASGLAVSEKMISQIRGLRQATRNVEDGVSFIQTTEGYLQETQDIMQRIRELAVQSANGIYTDNDRLMIQVEVSQLVDEVNRVASHAQFNTMNMLTGRFASDANGGFVGASMWIQMGANMDERRRVYIGTMTAAALGITTDGASISISTPDAANVAIGTADQALTKISKQRADLGAYQNRLEMAAKGLMIGHENMIASESRIRDTNMAEASVQYTRDQILMQANISALAQANMSTQGVLQLLG